MMIAPRAALFLVECVEPCRQPLDGRLQAIELVAQPRLVLAGVEARGRPCCAAASPTTAEAATAGAAGAALSRATSGPASGPLARLCTKSRGSSTVFIWHGVYLSEVLLNLSLLLTVS